MLVRYQRDSLLQRGSGILSACKRSAKDEQHPILRRCATYKRSGDRFPTLKGNQMATKICGFQSRKIAAFLAGLVTGVLIGGCSVFGPGLSLR